MFQVKRNRTVKRNRKTFQFAELSSTVLLEQKIVLATYVVTNIGQSYDSQTSPYPYGAADPKNVLNGIDLDGTVSGSLNNIIDQINRRPNPTGPDYIYFAEGLADSDGKIKIDARGVHYIN